MHLFRYTLILGTLLLSTLGLSREFDCSKDSSMRSLSYKITLGDPMKIGEDEVWFLKIVDLNQDKIVSGFATSYIYTGRYHADTDTRHFDLAGHVFSVNPKKNSAFFAPNVRTETGFPCTEL